jgi:hypothetical protein
MVAVAEQIKGKIDVTEKSELEGIYTPLLAARKELQRRWSDENLKRKVESFLGGKIPNAFQSGFNAALFRFIATPNLECRLAKDMASLADLNFVFMEYLNDRFCTRNVDKVHLGRLSFFSDKNKRKSEVGSRVRVIDFTKSEKVPFKNIRTLKGENFIDFHHRLFEMESENNPMRTFDVSTLKLKDETAMDVYMKIFALFICHGILFENYFVNTNPDEREFTESVIVPVFWSVYEIFGVKPLITPIISNRDESVLWQYYPDHMVDMVK